MQSTPPQSDTARRLLLIAGDLAERGLLPTVPGLIDHLAEELAKVDEPQQARGLSRAAAALEIGLALLAAHGWPRTAFDADDWAEGRGPGRPAGRPPGRRGGVVTLTPAGGAHPAFP